MKNINSVEEIGEILNKKVSKKNLSSNEIFSTKSKTKKNNGCKSGFTVTQEIIEEDKLKAKVLKYISYKKRTENEIRQKFANEDQFILENVIEYFKSQNYINENSYIEKSIKEFFAIKNLSIKELKYKLLQKGVNKKLLEEYIENNLDKLINYEIESAKKIIIKKSSKMDVEDIKKYLFYKGYTSETVSLALNEIL